MARDRWFSNTPQRGAHTILLTLPHAGGSAGVFRAWQARLGSTIDVRTVRYPGHADRFGEPLATDCRAQAQDIVDALVPLLDRPIALFGHSLGALIAFEIAALLENGHGITPTRLIVSGSPAPHLPSKDALTSTSTDDEIVAALRELDDDNQSTLDNPELRGLFLPVLRADFLMAETYRSARGRALDTPIVALGGVDDVLADSADLDAWADYTNSGFHRADFPGGHFYLFNSSEQAVIARVAALLAEPAPARPVSAPL